VKGYTDLSLYKTIQECQDVRKSLRKVADPELAREVKKKQLTLQNVRTKLKGDHLSDGYLGMSPGSLRHARKFLKPAKPDQMMTSRPRYSHHRKPNHDVERHDLLQSDSTVG